MGYITERKNRHADRSSHLHRPPRHDRQADRALRAIRPGRPARHLGKPLAWLITETGEINTYVHLWVYEDAADRAKKRAAMQADPEWQVFLAKSAEAGYLIKQENKLMTPASFAPISWP